MRKLKTWLILQVAMLIYSLSSICSKMAGGQSGLTMEFVLWCGGLIVSMGVYALLWQQVLKQMPLTTAYAGKAMVILWGIFWGWLLFGEGVSLRILTGAAVVMAGVYLMVTEPKVVSSGI